MRGSKQGDPVGNQRTKAYPASAHSLAVPQHEGVRSCASICFPESAFVFRPRPFNDGAPAQLAIGHNSDQNTRLKTVSSLIFPKTASLDQWSKFVSCSAGLQNIRSSSPADSKTSHHATSSVCRSMDRPSQLTDYASRIANRHAVGWDIFGNNAACANGRVASNANAGKNYSV
jgi:hypothetical protein